MVTLVIHLRRRIVRLPRAVLDPQHEIHHPLEHDQRSSYRNTALGSSGIDWKVSTSAIVPDFLAKIAKNNVSQIGF